MSETELKSKCLWNFSQSIMTGLRPRLSFRPVTISHSKYLFCMIQWAPLVSYTSSILAVVDAWVKQPQVTSTSSTSSHTSAAYSWVPLDVHITALKNVMWIVFLFFFSPLCVSFTLLWLNFCHVRSFISASASAKILLLLFPINDWFYV